MDSLASASSTSSSPSLAPPGAPLLGCRRPHSRLATVQEPIRDKILDVDIIQNGQEDSHRRPQATRYRLAAVIAPALNTLSSHSNVEQIEEAQDMGRAPVLSLLLPAPLSGSLMSVK